jgi:hypothetical protein
MIIVNHTKQPEQNLINTVKTIETMKESTTHIISKGHPSFKSAKYYCSTPMSIIF